MKAKFTTHFTNLLSELINICSIQFRGPEPGESLKFSGNIIQTDEEYLLVFDNILEGNTKVIPQKLISSCLGSLHDCLVKAYVNNDVTNFYGVCHVLLQKPIIVTSAIFKDGKVLQYTLDFVE